MSRSHTAARNVSVDGEIVYTHCSRRVSRDQISETPTCKICAKKQPTEINDSYVHAMTCGSCLKLWMDNEPIREGEQVVKLEAVTAGKGRVHIQAEGAAYKILAAWINVGVRTCRACIHASGQDIPSLKLS